VFLVGQRLFGIVVYGYSVTEWHVELLFGPQSFERKSARQSMMLARAWVYQLR
jgi:hypothetical protein